MVINIDLWNDCWINNSSLRSLLIGPLPSYDLHKKVSNIIVKTATSQSWNLNLIPFPLPLSLKDRIMGIALPTPRLDLKDKIYWNLTNNDTSTLSSAYKSCFTSANETPNMKWIWKTPCGQSEKLFLWKTTHLALPTMAVLHAKNISPLPTCPICNVEDDTVEHTLKNCSKTKQIRSFLNPQLTNPQVNFQEWIKINSTNSKLNILNIPWNTIFAYTIRAIWLHRNKTIHQIHNKEPKDIDIYALSKAAEFWTNGNLTTASHISHPPIQSQIFWSPPFLLAQIKC